MTLWVIRILFLGLAILTGYAVGQVKPGLVHGSFWGALMGFGFGGLLIAIDEMLRGFSLRSFSAATFGLLLGTAIAWMFDRSQLFIFVEDPRTLWLIRLSLFVAFGYIGMILALRSNKEDFSLIIPFVRFVPQNKPENLLVLDTSVIIDGRIADLIEANFVEGIVVVPRFVLRELQRIADADDPTRRARGRRGLEILSRIQQQRRNEVKIHEADPAQDTEVDAKLVSLAKILGAKLYTNDHNLAKIAELQSVACVNIHELSRALRLVLIPGEQLSLRLTREGKDKGQGVGYLEDGTMVVVNHAQSLIGHQVEVQVQSLLRTGAGLIAFADLRGSGPGDTVRIERPKPVAPQ
jgi:uncharacterized protein YacL